MIKISARLLLVAAYVDDNITLLDVGCDHGLLDIYLAQTKNNIKVIASDVNPNALASAKHNIKNNNLDRKITTILSDGLDKIDDYIDTIILAGLGSYKIVSILNKDQHKLKTVQKLIIQSNSNLYYLRKNVTKLGYYIYKEELIKENNIYYNIIVFKQGKKHYCKKQLYQGLLDQTNPLVITKKNKDLDKLYLLLKMIPRKNFIKRLKIRLKICMIK